MNESETSQLDCRKLQYAEQEFHGIEVAIETT